MRSREILAGIGLSVAAAAMGSACVGAEKEAAPRPEISTTTTSTTEVVSSRESLDEYLVSPTRTEKLHAAIQYIGNKVVDLAESKKIGYFDAYHPQADTWRSRKVSEGWVWLQHVEEYGGSGEGSEDQFSVTVWQNADGTFDRSRGILSVMIIDRNRGDDNFVSWSELSVPGEFAVSSQGEQPKDYERYQSEFGVGTIEAIQRVDGFGRVQTVEEAAQIDQQAVDALYAYFN